MEIVHFIPPTQRRLALLAAQTDSAPVLICGASGTGKGIIARWVHANSPRSGKLIMSASREKALGAQIAEAQGGTLVVGEIGSWPLGEQKTLLNYLNTKSVAHPDGNGTRMLVNTRIMATTSQALEGRAQGGLFNAELLGKLNVFRLEMPELAERTNELNDIIRGILGEITRELHKEHLKDFSADAWTKLKDYHWPGNLRELRNVLRVATITAQGDQIEATDIPDFDHDRIDFRATREEFEKVYIMELLKTFNWQFDKTCRISRIDKDVLMGKIKKYGITIPAPLS
ncbi:MAG: sigma-54-dependent transcriptional regulator [Bacteriovoracia bacterium]